MEGSGLLRLIAPAGRRPLSIQGGPLRATLTSFGHFSGAERPPQLKHESALPAAQSQDLGEAEGAMAPLYTDPANGPVRLHTFAILVSRGAHNALWEQIQNSLHQPSVRIRTGGCERRSHDEEEAARRPSLVRATCQSAEGKDRCARQREDGLALSCHCT